MDRKSPPPILFDVLKKAYLPDELQEEVCHLLELKKSIREKETGPRIKRIDEFISSVVSEVEKYLEIAVENKQSDWDELNSIFLQLLEKVC